MSVVTVAVSSFAVSLKVNFSVEIFESLRVAVFSNVTSLNDISAFESAAVWVKVLVDVLSEATRLLMVVSPLKFNFPLVPSLIVIESVPSKVAAPLNVAVPFCPTIIFPPLSTVVSPLTISSP